MDSNSPSRVVCSNAVTSSAMRQSVSCVIGPQPELTYQDQARRH